MKPWRKKSPRSASVRSAGLFYFSRWRWDCCTLIFAGVFAGRAQMGRHFAGHAARLGFGPGEFALHHSLGLQTKIRNRFAQSPIVDFLRDKPYEHRVADLPFHTPHTISTLFDERLYRIEWAQHHFPYYNIQSLDIVQMPRMPADLEAFERALACPRSPKHLLPHGLAVGN